LKTKEELDKEKQEIDKNINKLRDLELELSQKLNELNDMHK